MAVDVRRDQSKLSAAGRDRVKRALFAMKRMPLTRDRLAPTATDASVYSPDPPASGSNAPRNAYDQYVHWHDVAFSGANVIHGSPMFLPWHRWLLRLFELDLKRADYLLYNPASGTRPPQPARGEPAPGAITLPYWDFCQHVGRSQVAGQPTVPWTTDLLGPFPTSSGGMSSPFGWPVGHVPGDFGDASVWPIYFPNRRVPEYDRSGVLGRLTRRLVADRSVVANDLPYAQRLVGERPAEPGSLDMITSYDSNPWDGSIPATQSFRNAVEGWSGLSGAPTLDMSVQIHNRAHMWVGGIIVDVPIAANDPAFFFLHANVDRYWSYWQFYSARYDRTRKQYPPKADYPEASSNIEADMLPWDAGQPNHTEFGKVVRDTFATRRIGPRKFDSSWVTVPRTTGYRYDAEPTRPVLRRP